VGLVGSRIPIIPTKQAKKETLLISWIPFNSLLIQLSSESDMLKDRLGQSIGVIQVGCCVNDKM